MEHTTPSALQPGELAAAARLHPADPVALLGHLRWCMHTPYAGTAAVRAGDALCGVATVVHFAQSSRIGAWHLHPQLAREDHARSLLRAVVQQVHARGTRTVVAQVAPAQVAWWRAQGFAEHGAFETYAGGSFIQATHDEVVPLEPQHRMALLRLDQLATGEDRSTLLLEHGYAAQAYVVAGALRGVLLPLLGQGLLVADAPAPGLELQRWLLPVQARIVVPEGNTAATTHLLDRAYDVVNTSVRMVLGPPPALRPERVFAWPWG